ncbi:bifunctional enoyl-CoA hydratase/phosphate acetyltransferase [Geobacter argillaceus]|uniref:Phosphate butyryltransferase n=1 Tax=Geobacter argillaceus TaxID=345631 RepID=A0A562VIK8_9BACT|nr:bifunctional enoyl-CoA hydratase/phosphate acetyltransferase [Geobacter argillaceus]TWJ17783.1 phosphate butyryltransferase [Geobacter argillaceus]
MIKSFNELIAAVQEKPKKKVAIAAPEGTTVIELVKKATEEGIAEFILVGNEEKIKSMCAEAGFDSHCVNIINITDQKEAAEEAVRLVVAGGANAIMKGNLPTATFMRAILDKQKGLNDNKVISEITIYEKIVDPAGGGFRFLTDCAINVQPTLDEKKQIIENAVGLAHKLGNPLPKVAVISAVEVVNPAMPDTIEAAALSKMADRGQITGCIVDGPFAFDNAISVEAAEYKKVGGEVGGHADIIMMPNLLAANPLRKCLVYYTKQRIATALMGAKAPVILTSRTDSADTMLLTIALAAYIS